MRELAKFQIDQNKASQATMEEQQIDAIPLVANSQALLPSYEREVAPQFEEEMFEVANERVFKVRLGILVAKAEEL